MAHISDFRGKSSDELKELALSLKKELFNLRFQVASGELTNTARFKDVRRDVARVKTALNEPKDFTPAPKKVKTEKKVKAPAAPKAAKAPKAQKAPKKATKKKESGE